MSSDIWVTTMRETMRRNYRGWSAFPSGKVKKARLCFTDPTDGSRSSVTTDIKWQPDAELKVPQLIGELRQLMDERSMTLPQAMAIKAGGDAAPGRVSWPAVAEKFLATKKDRRSTTTSDMQTRVERAVELLTGPKPPQSGLELFQRYGDRWFDYESACIRNGGTRRRVCAPGGSGRRRVFGDLAALLNSAITKCGAAAKWEPPTGEDLDLLIGVADDPDDDGMGSTPIKPEQLARFLDDLKARGNERMWAAVALIGCLGLRPAELGAIHVIDDELRVSDIKRNKRTIKKTTKTKAKLVMPLEIPGRTDGKEAVDLYMERGIECLPQSVQNQIARYKAGEVTIKAVGHSIRQLILRDPFWKQLLEEEPSLIPYSLRHGFAYRGSKSYRNIPIRDLARLMRHTVETHMKHYGQWTSEDDLRLTLSLAEAA